MTVEDFTVFNGEPLDTALLDFKSLQNYGEYIYIPYNYLEPNTIFIKIDTDCDCFSAELHFLPQGLDSKDVYAYPIEMSDMEIIDFQWFLLQVLTLKEFGFSI